MLSCVRAWRTAGQVCVVVDGSAKVLRALELSSTTNELVQFLKCYYEAEDDGVQVTTVAMLVLGLASVVDNWFAGSGKQMTVHTEDVAADEFNRESSRLVLICRDLHSDILGYPTESKSERWCFFVLFSFFDYFTPFFDQNAKTTFLIKKSDFLIERRGQTMNMFLPFFDPFFHYLTLFF